MNKIMIAAMLFSSSAFAEIRDFDNPNKLQCGPAEEVWDVLNKKYNEKIELIGSSGNGVSGKKAVMFLLTNPESNTYTFVNFYPDSDFACVVDSGKIKNRKKVTVL